MLQENIYTLRRKAGLSQEQLAERLEVTRQTVSKWETGRSVPDLEKLEAMARVFGVTLNELTGTEEPAPGQPAARTGHMGMALCVAGAGCLILLGVLSLAAPQTAEQMNASYQRQRPAYVPQRGSDGRRRVAPPETKIEKTGGNRRKQDEKGFVCTGRAAGRGGTAVRVQRLRKADRRVCGDI